MMPGLSGLELCRALRSDPRTAGATIVMVTARALPATATPRSPPAPTTTSPSRSRPSRCWRPSAMPSELAALARACGLPLTSFRREHVGEQVERACRREQVGADEALAGRLRRDGEARRRFRRSVAISHGALFRDPEQFELLETTLLPRLLAGGSRLSAWSAGCSDGAELHSLGLVLERLGALERALLLGQRPAGGEPRAGPRGGLPVGAARADALGAARSGRGRPAARALAARAVPQRRDLPRARARRRGCTRRSWPRWRRAASCCSGAASG